MPLRELARDWRGDDQGDGQRGAQCVVNYVADAQGQNKTDATNAPVNLCAAGD